MDKVAWSATPRNRCASIGTPGPFLAENPPRFELRTNEDVFDMNDAVILNFVLLNPRDEWVTISFDNLPWADYQIAAADSVVLYGSSTVGEFPSRQNSITLPAGGERLTWRIWSNSSAVVQW